MCTDDIAECITCRDETDDYDRHRHISVSILYHMIN